uniref:Uncharacterized protein n=1 Tax=Anopheles coluzzii TaxID=1518534 RepID=A0A8W7P726_ANOCL
MHVHFYMTKSAVPWYCSRQTVVQAERTFSTKHWHGNVLFKLRVSAGTRLVRLAARLLPPNPNREDRWLRSATTVFVSRPTDGTASTVATHLIWITLSSSRCTSRSTGTRISSIR